MTKEILDKAKYMVARGYDMNKVAAILMVDKISLIKALKTPSGKPKKTKK
tara:strand:- start:1228 stop:1377 length:150 start_codon:yes stop_codon:yes gene_type:complete